MLEAKRVRVPYLKTEKQARAFLATLKPGDIVSDDV